MLGQRPAAVGFLLPQPDSFEGFVAIEILREAPARHAQSEARPGVPFVRLDLIRPPVDPNRLRSRLPDPEPRRPPRPTVRRLVAGGADELALTPPPAYFQALAGIRVPERGGYVHCPLPGHEERTASCHVWPDPERGWWCFGCARGGGIYDLASALHGGPTGSALRGDAFGAARERVRESLD